MLLIPSCILPSLLWSYWSNFWHQLFIQAFILHFQLKTFIFKSALVEKPFLNTIPSSTNDSGANRSLNVSSASFGSNVSLGGYHMFKLAVPLSSIIILFNFYCSLTSAECGMPCRIAFSNSEIRDVYVIPVAYEMIGKLILAEKHPFRSRHGVVIAIAPLAALCVSQYCLKFLLVRD